MNAEFTRKLAIPMEVKEMLPATPQMTAAFERGRSEIAQVIRGESPAFLLVIGPCSADNERSVMEYVLRLARLQEQVAGTLLLVPRVYTNKPRSSGLGYKGMLHQPDPTGKPDMFEGILATRRLYMRVLAETGFAPADELLYCSNYKYFDDLLGYCVVGARSVEDQEHRLTASALDIPVGMKNPTHGSIQAMMNAITAAQSPHTFLYRGWEAHSAGNPLAHAVLRGYTDRAGCMFANYGWETIAQVAEQYQQGGQANPAIIVDCNHANSGKQPLEQVRIAHEVVAMRERHDVAKRLVKGLMIESYLEDGAQPVGGSVFGQSITDPCLGWEKTERLVLELAQTLSI